MMKEIFTNLGLFLLFAIVLSGCSSQASTSNESNGGADSNVASTDQSANSAGGAENVTKRSDYPPIPKAVAQSEIKFLDGTVVKVEDRKGKVILLNLWATWCGPCRAEMPALVKMQDAHRDENFEVIGLNTDEETVEQINEFASKMGLNYTLAWADTGLQSALVNISKFGGIPQSFLIDRDGNLRGVFRGAAKADVVKMQELVELVVNE